MLRHIRPSIRSSACPSVTLRYCVKTRECRGIWSSPSSGPVFSFLVPRMVDGEDPVQVKFECKEEVDPCEISRTVRISPHNSGTIINSENSSLNAIESRPWSFQGRAPPLSSAKWGSDTQICRLSHKFHPKAIKRLLQSFVVLKLPAAKL